MTTSTALTTRSFITMIKKIRSLPIKPGLIAVCALLGVLVLAPAKTIPSMSLQPQDPPRPEDVRVLEELSQWLSGPDTMFHRELGIIEDPTLAIRAYPESFEVFRQFHERDDRNLVLLGFPYGRLIDRAAKEAHIDGLLLAAVIEAESGFSPSALSPVGAVGLAQLMPSTAMFLGLEDRDLTDPETNLKLGAIYLRRMIDQFDGDLVRALAAYNAGPGAVERFGDVPPYRETQSYVRKVLGRYVGFHQEVWERSGAATEMDF